MSEQPQRPDPQKDAGGPPSVRIAPDVLTRAAGDDVLDGAIEPSDDTPTIISKAPPRPPGPDNLFSGILRGRRLAHFELIEPIGVGGMAAVLRARDTQLERSVALKILPPEMATDPENIARFHQEARAAARLDHETIARVFFCGEDQNLHFIAFEFVEGENLRTIIDRRGPLPVPEALHYMLQVATGLAHAAERGVVHRDIKPSNIIISPNGRAKLVDMGLARNLGPQTDDGLTQSGVTLGTFDYISPEQALEPRDADVRSDIYSLGCTFYHVLTGQPSVPEGTAARKLHHHQHVPPTDPRQLNPDVPDEVAAILGRMMAKDVRQRYQRAEHLVQHLLQMTQRLGAGPGGPDGVLFVDAALPAPPRTRPLLVAGCAAAIVVVLVFLVGPSQGLRLPIGGFSPGVDLNKQASDPSSPSSPADVAQGGGQPANTGEGPKSVPPAPEADKLVQRDVKTEADLADLARDMAAEKGEKRYEITLKGDLRLDGADLVLQGKAITLKGDPTKRPTLWCRCLAAAARPAGLVLDAKEVTLDGLRVVADAGNGAPAQPQMAAGLLVLHATTFKAERCEFLQGNWLTSSLFSSVALQPGADAHVSFTGCGFLGGKTVKRPDPAAMGGDGWLAKVEDGGQTAVAVQGAATVTAGNCAFGPHAALFRFEGKSGDDSRLIVDHCTALAGDEWALADAENTSPRVTARYSLFGRARDSSAEGGMMMMADRKTACLVRQGPGASATYRDSANNRYWNLDAVVWQDGGDPPAPETFVRQLADTRNGTEKEVLPPDSSPWKEKAPLALLQKAPRSEDLLAAFRPDAAAVPELRYKPDALVGVQASPWGLVWGDLPPLAAAVVKVVDPSGKTDTARRVYQSLEEALAAPRDGDEIVIRHTGDLPVSPLALTTGVSVTIRADGESRPVLMLRDDAPDAQAALFRVHKGQLNLDRLEFRLRPKQAGFESQAVAMLSGDGGVQLTRCVVTLDSRDVALAAVTLADPKNAMPQAAGSAGPKIVFDTCFVRGAGDLVAARASRPFALDVKDSLVALTGSLLNIDAGTGEAPPAPEGQTIPLKLSNVTAYLGGHLLRLRAASLSSLVPVSCNKARSCLLVCADAHQKALVHLEAGPKDDQAALGRLDWNGESNNYAGFAPMLDQKVSDNDTPAMTLSRDRWKGFVASDSESHFEAVTFKGPVWAEGGEGAAAVLPQNFLVKSGPKGIGVQKPVPAPTQ